MFAFFVVLDLLWLVFLLLVVLGFFNKTEQNN